MRWLYVGGVGVGRSVWGLRIVGSAVKEGEGGNVAVDREDFGEDKAEKLLAHPLLQPV